MRQSILNVLVVFAILFIFHSCSWEYDKTIHEIPFERVRYEINGKDSIGVYGKLKENSIIDGYPCAANWVRLSKDFKLIEFCTSKDFEVAHVNLKKGTWVFLTDRNTTCVLPEDTQIQGFICMGNGDKKGVQTSFDTNGKLIKFFSPKDVDINHILCKGGIYDYISLYKDGKLKSCTLAKDQKINGEIYQKGAKIIFDEELNVQEVK